MRVSSELMVAMMAALLERAEVIVVAARAEAGAGSASHRQTQGQRCRTPGPRSPGSQTPQAPTCRVRRRRVQRLGSHCRRLRAAGRPDRQRRSRQGRSPTGGSCRPACWAARRPLRAGTCLTPCPPRRSCFARGPVPTRPHTRACAPHTRACARARNPVSRAASFAASGQPTVSLRAAPDAIGLCGLACRCSGRGRGRCRGSRTAGASSASADPQPPGEGGSVRSRGSTAAGASSASAARPHPGEGAKPAGARDTQSRVQSWAGSSMVGRS